MSSFGQHFIRKSLMRRAFLGLAVDENLIQAYLTVNEKIYKMHHCTLYNNLYTVFKITAISQLNPLGAILEK